ncbi:G-type lectin S-receptor-like serine/threonine-protein kinase At1g61420 [Rosa rugosa]|uniref:G-type lectin S-receptor-like serine/threonine-protein kinase At1g61420 n=1 Tax=Rosa rugosa TaxID=74645 RepID=UPI002B404FEC|nr:G-type lectin S-receptor-like serine/threonine-protein kinase At1g61420 [Rosa rugosa]
MDPTYLNVFNLVEDVEKGTAYISFNTYNSSPVTNLVISPEGVLKQMRKREGKDWVCAKVRGGVAQRNLDWRLGQNADNCRIWCLNNCSCLAYAHVIGIGCLVWSKSLVDIQQFSFGGQQLFLRLANSELVGDNKTRKTIYSVVAVSVVTISGTILVFIFHKRRADERGNMKDAKEHFHWIGTVHTSSDTLQCVDRNDPSDLPLLDFDSISIATNFFNAANKLGQGGFGPVYKGELQDGRDIAVKRLSSSSGQGVEEFKNEIILISKLRHRNLVRLMGYCIDREERLLIYEFLQNKSLDTFLFGWFFKPLLLMALSFVILASLSYLKKIDGWCLSFI